MSKKRLVSVCIPTRNRALYLGQAVKSVLNQDYDNYEVIIADNHSSDNTEQLIRSLNDKRVRYYRNAKNIGLARNWNRALQYANGDYVTIFHDDDVMLPGNISKKAFVLDAQSNVGLVHSNIERIDAGGKRVGAHWAKRHKDDYIRKGSECFMEMLLGNNFICAPTAMIRKDCFNRLGAFNKRLPYTCDWEMWLRIMLFYDIAYIKEPLVYYRCHPAMTTEEYLRTKGLRQIYKAKKNVLLEYALCIKDHKRLIGEINGIFRRRAFDLCMRYARQKRIMEAVRSLLFGFEILRF